MLIPITYLLIGLTILISIRAFSDRDLQFRLMLIPNRMTGGQQLYRLFSHALVHADWMHLFFNMYALYLFGYNKEGGVGFGTEAFYMFQFGTVKGELFYLLLYVGGIMVSAFPSYERHKRNAGYMSLGASGAVSAVVFAYILINPLMKLSFFFIPVGIPAWIFGAGYLVYSWFKSKSSTDNIDHFAHFWGSIYGILFTIAVRPSYAIEFAEQIRFFLLNGSP